RYGVETQQAAFGDTTIFRAILANTTYRHTYRTGTTIVRSQSTVGNGCTFNARRHTAIWRIDQHGRTQVEFCGQVFNPGTVITTYTTLGRLAITGCGFFSNTAVTGRNLFRRIKLAVTILTRTLQRSIGTEVKYTAQVRGSPFCTRSLVTFVVLGLGLSSGQDQ